MTDEVHLVYPCVKLNCSQVRVVINIFDFRAEKSNAPLHRAGAYAKGFGHALQS